MYWGKKSTKHKKAKGARISNKSLPTVINSWPWSQRERKARGLGRVSLTQQHSSENLRWPQGSFFGKAAFWGVLFCLKVELLFHCHFQGLSIVGNMKPWPMFRVGIAWSHLDREAVNWLYFCQIFFFFFWKEVCASYLHGCPEDFWLTQSHFNNLFKQLKLSSQHKIAAKSTRLKETINTGFAINSFILFATFFTFSLLIVS